VKVFVETYGCTMNQGEGRQMLAQLAALGHEAVDSAAEADLVVLNTCVVIKTTEDKMVKRIRELSGQRKNLIVTGCLASAFPDAVVKNAPYAYIMPPGRYGDFTDLVAANFGGTATPVTLPSEVTAILPIAQGCVGACTYCITRAARGRLRSYPEEDILSAARQHLAGGSQELLVTAQDTACYGFDRGTDLGALLRRLAALPGDFRMRVGMMNPNNLARIEGSFVPAWLDKKVYQFIHLPVQSGSDAVLGAMGRGYHANEVTGLVGRLRDAAPEMTLSTDVIAGFPGETDGDHRATVELLRSIEPDIVNVTRFSPRPGTPAHRARDQVPGWVAKERSRELSRLRLEIAGQRNAQLVGRTLEVLITERGKGSTMIGRTSAYKPVVISRPLPLGTIVSARITASAPTHLFGRVEDRAQ